MTQLISLNVVQTKEIKKFANLKHLKAIHMTFILMHRKVMVSGFNQNQMVSIEYDL